MNEQKVPRLPCTHDDCIRRLQERAYQAFEAGDIETTLRLAKFVPNQADLPSTPPPEGFDFT